MPIYDYQCVDCGARDHRIAGADDHAALCVACGGLMLRLDVDVFGPYFEAEGDLKSEPETIRLRSIIDKEAPVCTCLLSYDTCRHCRLEEKLMNIARKGE
jgi:putative FmdB family regulatory protein